MPLFKRSNSDEPPGLQTREQITLSNEREDVLLKRAERRTREFELLQRRVLLALAIPIGISVGIGSFGHPELLKLAVAGASAWGAVTATLLGIQSKFRQPAG